MKKHILAIMIAAAMLSVSAAPSFADEITAARAEEAVTEQASAENSETDASAEEKSDETSDSSTGNETTDDSEETDKTTEDSVSDTETEAEDTPTVNAQTSGNYSYRAVEDGIEILKYTGSESAVEIPETLDDQRVIAIGSKAFAGNTSLKSVTMKENIGAIGAEAFSGCTALTTVQLSDIVQVIEEKTFYDCAALSSINMPSYLVVIYESAFENCSSLASVTFPDTLQYLASGAFYSCTALDDIVLPPELNDFNGSVFGGCTALANINVSDSNPYYSSNGSVVFSKDGSALVSFPCAHSGIYEVPEGTVSIGYAAFYKSGLTEITLPSTLKRIGNAAFTKSESLTYIEIPDSVTYIGGYAFSGCSSLKYVVLPDSVSKISEYTFANCPSLERIVVPSSVSAIGENAFSGVSQDCVVESDSESSSAYSFAGEAGMNREVTPGMETHTIPHEDEEDADPVIVIFNGSRMEFEANPKIINDRTVVPLRALFEEMGAEVIWNDNDRSVSASLGDTIIDISIGSSVMWRNGNAIELEAAAEIYDDFTFVPLRAVSEAFGADVSWDPVARAVNISFVPPAPEEEEVFVIEDEPPVTYFSDPSEAERAGVDYLPTETPAPEGEADVITEEEALTENETSEDDAAEANATTENADESDVNVQPQ